MSNTKNKWFRSTNKNIPQLTNNWGDLVRLLDACLVTGTSEQSIINATVSSDNLETTDIVTFTYLEAHKYYQYQVIEVSGSELSAVNGEHRILSVSKDGLSITYKIDTSISDVGSLLNIKTKLASAGWNIRHSETNKRIYQGTSTTGKNCCFFVDNEKHPLVGDNWMKMARVGYAEDFESFEKPLGISIPNNWDNFIPYQSGSDVVMGGFNMVYATYYSPDNGLMPSSVPSDGIREWTLIVDDSCFYLLNATSSMAGHNTQYLCHFFGQYDPIIEGWDHNVAIAANAWTTMQKNTVFTPSVECGSLYSIDRPFYSGVTYSNSGENNQLTVRSIHGVDRTGMYNVTNPLGPTQLFKAFVRDSAGTFLGTMKNFYWTSQMYPFQHNQVFTQDKFIYIAVNTSSAGNITQAIYKIGEI